VKVSIDVFVVDGVWPRSQLRRYPWIYSQFAQFRPNNQLAQLTNQLAPGGASWYPVLPAKRDFLANRTNRRAIGTVLQ